MGIATVMPLDTFDSLQLDAGVVVIKFNPNAPEILDSAIVCATTGGINASCVPTFNDLGSDVDNCPANMMELKHLDSWLAKLAFTSLGTSKKSIRMALGAADINATTGAITPRRNLKQTDFEDSIWWVGDRADGGLVAIELKHALSTSGFALKTAKAGKGQVSVELTGHVSIKEQDVMPMVIYSLDPQEPPAPPVPVEYGITADANIENGGVSFEVDGNAATKAEAGVEVTVIATPDNGYELGTITVTKDGGGLIPVTGEKFTMPDGAVTVSATFTEES